MKKKFRVKDNEEFNKIISKKNSLSNRCFIIYYLNNDLVHFRAGIAVSKKIGNAVTRNKVKRQIRMMIQETFDLNSSIDCVIIVKNQYLNLKYEENKKELNYMYQKLLKRMGK